MTFENRQLIGFEDIIGIQYECLRCHTKQVFPISNVQRAPTKCINCNELWFTGPMEKGEGMFDYHLGSIAWMKGQTEVLKSLNHLNITLEVISHEPEDEHLEK